MKTYLSLLKKALSVLLLPVVLNSCSSDIDDTLRITGNGDGEMNVTFSLNAGDVSSVTRALDSGDENEVRGVKVLVFDLNGDFLYDAPVRELKMVSADPGKYTFTATLRTGTFDLVFLANADKVVRDAYPSHGGQVPVNAGVTKTELEDKLLLTCSGGWNADPSDRVNYLAIPMWSELKGYSVSTGSAIDESINLVRMVAKIDVALKGTITPEQFKLTSVRFYNYNCTGRLVPDASQNWESDPPVVTGPSLPDDPGLTTGPLVFENMTLENRSLSGMIYAFEAAAGVPGDASSGDYMKNPCLVIGGKYGGSDTETFYRVDFAGKADGQVSYLPLLRNHNYTVTIQDIKGAGLPAPDDAFNSLPVNIEADVMDWVNGNIPDFVFDGQYVLGVNKGSFTFTRDERHILVHNNLLTVVTDVPGGWKAELFNDAEGTRPVAKDPYTNEPWLRISVGSGSGSYPAGDDVVLMMDANHETPRTAYIHLTAGRLHMVIPVTQTLESEVWLNIKSTPDLQLRSGVGSVVGAADFKLDWYPDTSPVSVRVTPMSNGGVDITGLPSSITELSGFYEGSISANPMSEGEVVNDPFRERTSLIEFTVTNDWGESVKENVIVRQTHYSVVVDFSSDHYNNYYQMLPVKRASAGYNERIEQMSTELNKNKVIVRSNGRWQVAVKEHDSNGGSVRELITTGGNGNTAGEEAWFRMMEDGSDSKWKATTVLEFTSPDGYFEPFTVNVDGYWGYLFVSPYSGSSSGYSLFLARPEDAENSAKYNHGDAVRICKGLGNWILPELTPLRNLRFELFGLGKDERCDDDDLLALHGFQRDPDYWSDTGSALYYNLNYGSGAEHYRSGLEKHYARCVWEMEQNVPNP